LGKKRGPEQWRLRWACVGVSPRTSEYTTSLAAFQCLIPVMPSLLGGRAQRIGAHAARFNRVVALLVGTGPEDAPPSLRQGRS
jgi:hypothetical protein